MASTGTSATARAPVIDLHLGYEDDAFDAAPRSAGRPQGGLPVDSVFEPLSAAEVLRHFLALRDRWFEDALAETAGIERLLREEARLSEEWQGLPGTDHRALWDRTSAGAAPGASKPERRDLGAEWQPDLWVMAPIVRRKAGTLALRMPPTVTSQQLEQAVMDHLPARWRKERVVVRLEIETRMYWGARSPDDDSPWEPCSVRGDGVGLADPIIEIDAGKPRWLQSQHEAVAPLVRRSLRAGVGLLVAVPVLSYERIPQPLGWFGRWGQRVLDWLDRARGVRRDRDPTFQSRLACDEAWWAKALGTCARTARQIKAATSRGALLAEASAPALAHSPSLQASTHVVLLHGGLSSARAGFDAWSPESATPHSLWQGFEALRNACTWRFEHDTFIGLGDNIEALIEAVHTRIVGKAVRGRIVLLAHSRGGAVARFALPSLRDRWPGWDFHAFTFGGPHFGTPVFEQLGQRWVGFAGVLGLVSRAARGVLDRDMAAQLKNIERGMAGAIPEGFRDVLPSDIAQRARGAALPAQMQTWGSRWRPELAQHWSDSRWHHVIEDFAGFEADGDGIVPIASSMVGPQAHDASPVAHTEYFHHAPTVAQLHARLTPLLREDTPCPLPSRSTAAPEPSVVQT